MSAQAKTSALTLEILQKFPDGISGETIAEKLGISRNAVWKAITELRSEGFSIEASSGRGYRLTGERYMTAEGVYKYLKSNLQVQVFRSVSSTNDLAKAAAESLRVKLNEVQTTESVPTGGGIAENISGAFRVIASPISPVAS